MEGALARVSDVRIMYEIVEREKPRKTTYIRKSPDRSFEAGSYYRKLNMLQFAKIAHSNYGKSFEEHIASMREKMKPVGRAPRPRTIELTEEGLFLLKLQMLRRGIKRLYLPEHINIKIVAPLEREEVVKRLERLVFA